MLLAMLVGALGLATVASAQDDQQPTPPSPGSDDGNIPPETMKQQAAAVVVRIDAVDDQVAAMLQKAKDDGNVVRLLCLTDKGNQVVLALGTAKDRQTSLLAALSRGAQGRARHEYRLLMVLGDSVELLSAEANQCLGGEAGLVGESTLTVEIDPSLPEPDPDVIAVAPIVAIVPLVASPTD